MARKGVIPRKDKDHLSEYNKKKVLFVNMLMKDGKKEKARKIVEQAFHNVWLQQNKDATGGQASEEQMLELINRVIDIAGPNVEVKTKRIGGANYPVPVPVSVKRRIALAFRWIIRFSRKKKGKSMVECLTQELQDVLAERGATVTEKLNMRRMAEANKAFAHLR